MTKARAVARHGWLLAASALLMAILVGSAAFVAYLSSLTNLKFSATQYALLSSIMLLLPRLIGGYSGVIVEKFGYHDFFLITALLGVPTLILIALQWHQEAGRGTPVAEEHSAAERP